MLALFAALALVLVFVIAAVVIGRESNRLAGEAPRPVFDIDEAVEWVAAQLPFEVSAVLSHDDVRHILRWNLDHLAGLGLSEAPPSRQGQEGVSAPDELIVVGGGEAVEAVLARAMESGRDLDAEQVAAVLEAQLAYLEAIGAVGPLTPGDQPRA